LAVLNIGEELQNLRMIALRSNLKAMLPVVDLKVRSQLEYSVSSVAWDKGTTDGLYIKFGNASINSLMAFYDITFNFFLTAKREKHFHP
jgi:hypothetical protein